MDKDNKKSGKNNVECFNWEEHVEKEGVKHVNNFVDKSPEVTEIKKPNKNTLVPLSDTIEDDKYGSYTWKYNDMVSRGKTEQKSLFEGSRYYRERVLPQNSVQLERFILLYCYSLLTMYDRKKYKKSGRVTLKINLLEILQHFWPNPSYYPDNLDKIIEAVDDFFRAFVYEVKDGKKQKVIVLDNLPESVYSLSNGDPYITATIRINKKMSKAGFILNHDIIMKYGRREYYIVFLSNLSVYWNKEVVLRRLDRSKLNNRDYVFNNAKGLSRNALIRMVSPYDYERLTSQQKTEIYTRKILTGPNAKKNNRAFGMIETLVKDGIIIHYYNDETGLHYIFPREWYWKSKNDITKNKKHRKYKRSSQ